MNELCQMSKANRTGADSRFFGVEVGPRPAKAREAEAGLTNRREVRQLRKGSTRVVEVKERMATFRFFRPNARRVCLVGDFNRWGIEELPMKPTEEGYWLVSVELPRGTFKFRYWADGQWFVDFAGFGVERGDFGFAGVVRVV